MRFLSLCVILAACSTAATDPVVSELGMIESAPDLASVFPVDGVVGVPLPLDLELSTPVMQRGETSTFTVSGAAPGRTVVLAVGRDTGASGACPAAIAPECLDVPGPFFIVAQNLADANGEITFDLPIPVDLLPSELIFQAVSVRGSRVYLSDAIPTMVIDPYIDVQEADVRYIFRYNAAIDAADQYEGTVWPYIELRLYSDQWMGDYDDSENFCLLRMNSSFPLGRASWVAAEPDVAFGFDWPVGIDWDNGCANRLDPAIFGDVEAAVEAASWGVGVLDNLDPAVEAAYLGAGFPQSEVDQLVSGYWAGDWGALSTDPRAGLGAMYGVTPGGQLILDANGDLLRESRADVINGSQVSDAIFAMNFGINVAFLENL